MNLHIRLYINFWSHRKTAKLRAALGNDALWIMPRLWSYAAENQPNGDFGTYTPEEIALLIGYQGDAQAMLKAMLQASFMDEGMKLHGWGEHNGYHAAYSARAKKAAEARWHPEGSPTPPSEDRKGKDRIGAKQCSKQSQSIKGFQKPTVEECVSHGEKMGIPKEESEKFWHHHETRGWQLKSGPMKVWASAMVTWKRNWESGVFQPKGVSPVKKPYVPQTTEHLREAERQAAIARYEKENGKPYVPKEAAI